MTHRNLGLLVPRSVAEPDVGRWATVTNVSPLRIRLDGETVALPLTPDTLTAGLAISDRVWVALPTNRDPKFKARSVLVMGRSGGGIILDDSVTNAKLANMATQTFKGRTTAGTGDPEDMTIAQAQALLGINETIVRVKLADETVNNNAAFQNDDHLSCTLAANSSYFLDKYFIFNSGATPDIKTQLVGPSGMSGVVTLYSLGGSVVSNFSATSSVIWDGTGANQLARVFGFITTTNGGALNWQWGQNTANASNTIVRQGSYFLLIKF
jgi:hypothetical protein